MYAGEIAAVRIPGPGNAKALRGIVLSTNGEALIETELGPLEARVVADLAAAKNYPNEVVCWPTGPSRWPKESIFISADARHPSNIFGYGEWQALGEAPGVSLFGGGGPQVTLTFWRRLA